ncbi:MULTISPECIES: prepilin-type N-terminal cleavage/methylation domain-containing protein [unclassified Clostridium]|uniref:type IV pilus modification PilV family protein n=1 Tax=unclassified Clostridium TaxID=2614128 RepID=UPI00209ABC74|nr:MULTISPECIES: prepilin-type N-terminal cleavage/methylation domain-containing protein [unclassified Clostridium]WAG70158.1 prepilin-type N-terminal cleavage/methylation domain-containing protein [Clostridium sp. CF011]
MSKRGFTLVEVLCSLAVFSIIFICMMSYEIASLNIKKDIKTMNNNVLLMESLKNNIIYSMTYEELEQLKTDKKFFVNKENLSFDKSETDVRNVFSNQRPVSSPYMELTFSGPDKKVYKLNLSLYSGKLNNVSELQCSFYKGDHK